MFRLSEVLREYRWAKRIAVRELAKDIEISYPTLNRIERGGMPDGNSLAKILRWLLAETEERV